MSETDTARDLILNERLIVIVRATQPPDWIPAMLTAAGIRAFELSLASGDPFATLERWSRDGGDVLIGAGTVLKLDDARRAVEAGARYLVSPGFDPALQRWARERDVLHIPGVLTPTEVTAALAAGAPLLKLFPVMPLGPDYLHQLRGPFPRAQFVATGGIDDGNAEAFLAAGAAAVALGSAVVADDRDAGQVQARAKAIRAVVRTAQRVSS